MGKYTDNKNNVFRLASQCDICGDLDQRVMQLDEVLDVCLPCLEEVVSDFRTFLGTIQPSMALDASET